MNQGKFQQLEITAGGATRAFVELERLETLWFNTGTRCNIQCRHCYIESSPSNGRLEYLTFDELRAFLDEVSRQSLPVEEIGFTGGEPFLNPELLEMLEEALERGFDTIVLTNAMRPMERPRVRPRLLALRKRFGRRLHLRVSIDHHTPENHEKERGPGSWRAVLRGARWLSRQDFRLSVAGRTCWGGDEVTSRAGFARLFEDQGIEVDAWDPAQLVLFPELDSSAEVPEITVDCWDILGVRPSQMMCASSRMVVKRRGARRPVVVSCTLLPYQSQFELGPSLTDATKRVWLNHPHCSRFCVLGGGSCSVG